MIHIFDIDYTVIKKSSAGCFLREALNKGIISWSQIRQLPFEWLRYKLGRPNMDFIDDAVKHLAGIEKTTLEQTALSCFERRIKPNIYSGAVKLIKGALARGEKVIFATSSLNTLIQPLEDFFSINGSIASKLEFCDGKTTGKIAGNSLFGSRKKEAVEAWFEKNNLDITEARFYSDSYTDLPLLRICGKPVAVNPDSTLKKEALKNDWEILHFKKTIEKKQIC